MRLGIFGGTFDPVHYGHLLLAETCREQLRLDEVRFLPAGNPPHKANGIASGQARADMLALALAGYPEFTVDCRELHRDGPSWTVLTLEETAQENPDSELCFLMGADSLRDFPNWREPQRILELAVVAAVSRPGQKRLSAEDVSRIPGDLPADRLQLLEMPGMDISSSGLRRRIQDGRSIRFLTPRAVEVFLMENNLYGESA